VVLLFERQPGPWSAPAGSTYVSGQTAFTRSLPFDYADQSLPVGMTKGYSTQASSYANPAALSYGAEIPLSPAEEEEEDEDDREVKVEEQKDPPPKRKRGRPRLNRTAAETSAAAASSQRVPHNQVERKYRETLNAEMERLRVNIPTLPRSEVSSLAGPPRPSKATVLAAAVQYIKDLEHDVETLADENEGLRHGQGSRSGGGGKRRSGYP
jgi:Helix-loop-helix DNA-binding domain